jgi:quercetin dioxygenase-like cupin family protein
MKRKEFIQGAALLGTIPFLSWSNDLKIESDSIKPILSSPNLNNSYWYIGHLMSVLISNKQTNGAFSLIHGYEIQGLEPPPHIHTMEDESFYLLSGKIEFTVGDKLLSAKGGDWVFLPRNIQHSFKVKSKKSEVLIHLSPGGFEDYFIEMSEPAKEMVIPPKPVGPPDVQKIIETASRYGIVFPKRN